MKDTIYPIDIATGEYVQGIQMTDEEERKRRKKYWELRNAKELRRIDHGPLGKFYLSACRSEQFEGLKPQDITRLIYLVSHLNYKNVLMLNERRKMTLTDLPAVLNVSDSTAKRFWDNVSGRYITQECDGTLVVQGTFFRGKQKYITERLTKFYIQSVQKLYRATPTSKQGCLGRVFQLLAFINVEYNILCRNPEETDLSRVAPMTLKEFCDETGYAVSKAHRLVVDLCSLVFDVDGEQRHFVAFVTNKASPNAEDRLIVVNPRVLYGGHNFERVEAFALFFRD